MTKKHIEYDRLTQNALRGVIHNIIKNVEKDGLPGDHHFYIAFDTTHQNAKLSKRLKEKYPEEMTIVLQYQFWGLTTSEDGFEVELSFDNIAEKLSIPYDAIRRFYDPSVLFGLQFKNNETNNHINENQNIAQKNEKKQKSKTPTSKNTADPIKKITEKQTTEKQTTETNAKNLQAEKPKETQKTQQPKDSQDPQEAKESQDSNVIHIDAFRQK